MLALDYDPTAPVVGDLGGHQFVTVIVEPSDIAAISLFHRDLAAKGGKQWRHPKAQALGSVLEAIKEGAKVNIAVATVGNQGDPGQAVAEALELSGDLNSFTALQTKIPTLRFRHPHGNKRG